MLERSRVFQLTEEVISVFSADAAKYQVSINKECKSVAKLQSRLAHCWLKTNKNPNSTNLLFQSFSFDHPLSVLFTGLNTSQLLVHEVVFPKCFKVVAWSQEAAGMVQWYTVNPMPVSPIESQNGCMYVVRRSRKRNDTLQISQARDYWESSGIFYQNNSNHSIQ